MSRTERKQSKKNNRVADNKRTFSHARHVTLCNAAMRRKNENVEVSFGNPFPSRLATDEPESSEETTSSKTQIQMSNIRRYEEYMTPPESERRDIIERTHLLGHFGINAIEKTIHAEGIHWTNLRKDIERIVKDCTACQQHTIHKVGYHPPRHVLPDGVFDHISVDLGTFNVTSSRGNNFLLLVVDMFSRFVILRAIPDKSAYTIAKELLSIWCLFGFSRIISHDNGSEFANEVLKELAVMTGVEQRLSLPYNPMGNSVCERYMGVCKKTIIKSITADAKNL